MSDTTDMRRGLRAVLRNALTWGVAWAIAGGAIVAAITLLRGGPGIESLPERLGVAALSGISWGVRFGLAGAVIGGVFSAVVRLGYRGRRLADISPVRFALLGAVVGGVGVPLYLQAMNILTGGHAIAWGLVVDDARWASVFGAAAAAGTILLARRADALRHGAHADELERATGADALPSAEVREVPLTQRSRSAQR
ncbi:MAG TPA: hypothetical protein VFK13_06710 [Gemmatimonadaceae bacterium]|nr:hypothetical protein [Gemmatimonadaceae bacterium]